MAYTVLGRLVDDDNKPLEFATVYISDANGKPKANGGSTNTDEKGRWKLNKVSDNDYITSTYVGFKKKTISAKSIIPIPNIITGVPEKMIQIKLTSDVQTKLPDINIESTKVTKSEQKIGKYIMYGGIGLAVLSLGLIIINKK